jgi:hypothetical protein
LESYPHHHENFAGIADGFQKLSVNAAKSVYKCLKLSKNDAGLHIEVENYIHEIS